MRAVRIPNHTRSLKAPVDWGDKSQGHCSDLLVRDIEVEGQKYMLTAWQAEGEEAGWLLAGGQLRLGVSGSVHPVVYFEPRLPAEDGPPVWVVEHAATPEAPNRVKVTKYIPARSETYHPAMRCYATHDCEDGETHTSVALCMREIEQWLIDHPEALLPKSPDSE